MKAGNYVYQQTTTTGTLDVTLTSVTGFQSFTSVFGTGSSNSFFYGIRHRTSNEYEIGKGYLSADGILVRNQVMESSNGNALVEFSEGTKDVYSDIPATYQNKNTVDTTTTLVEWYDAAKAGYQRLDWAPAVGNSGVRFATFGHGIHSTNNNISGVGHYGGGLFYGAKHGTGTDALVIGCEGRVGALKGTIGIGAAFLATFDTQAENPDGTITYGVGLYIPPQTGRGQIGAKFASYVDDSEWDHYSAAGMTLHSNQKVIPRDRVPVVDNKYYPCEGLSGAFTPAAITRETMYLAPFICPTLTTFTKIGVNCTTNVASSSAILSIYADSNGNPGTKILQSTVSLATTGEKEGTISQQLAPGVYWLGIVVQGGASDPEISWGALGHINTMGMQSVTTGSAVYAVSGVSAALPNPMSGGAYAGAGYVPHVWLRRT